MNKASVPNHLPAQIIELLQWLAVNRTDIAELGGQARSARVIKFTPTMIDLEVPAGSATLNVPDGPIAGYWSVLRDAQPVGEVLLWVRDGKLIGIEQTWYTDEVPQSWPAPSAILYEMPR